MLLRFKVFRSAWEGVFLGSGQLPGTVEPWEADFPYHPGKSTWKPKSWGLVQMIFPFSIWWFSGFTLVLGEWTSPTCSIWSIISPTDLTWILAPFDASHWLAEWVVSYYDNTWDHPKCQKQVWILCGPNNGFLHCSLQRRIEGESWDFFKHKSSSSNFCQSLPYLWPCHTRYKSRQYHNRIQANLLSNSPKFSTLQETNISYLPTWQRKSHLQTYLPCGDMWSFPRKVSTTTFTVMAKGHQRSYTTELEIHDFWSPFDVEKLLGNAMCFFHQILGGEWNQPIWKILVKLDHFPK